MRESIIPSYQCFQLKHGSPFLPIVNKLLRYLQEGGILEYWSKKTIYQAIIEGLLVPYEDYEADSFSSESLDLNRIFPTFLMLLAGYILASIAFVFEVLYKKIEDYRFAKMHPFIN